jgi:hypothetical protein
VPSPPPQPPVPAPTTTAPVNTAAWVIGTCFVDRRSTPPLFTGTVLVRNEDIKPHSYQVTVSFGQTGPPIEVTVPVIQVAPGQTGSADVSTPGNDQSTDPTVPCEITRLVDETGHTPTMSTTPLPPPPDRPPPDQPTPTTPAPPPVPTVQPPVPPVPTAPPPVPTEPVPPTELPSAPPT